MAYFDTYHTRRRRWQDSTAATVLLVILSVFGVLALSLGITAAIAYLGALAVTALVPLFGGPQLPLWPTAIVIGFVYLLFNRPKVSTSK